MPDRVSALPWAIRYPKSAIRNPNARVVELADTRVLEALAERLVGSSPAPGTSLRPLGYGWQASLQDAAIVAGIESWRRRLSAIARRAAADITSGTADFADSVATS